MTWFRTMELRKDFWWSLTPFPPKWLDIHNLRLRIAPSLVQNTPCLNQFEAALEFGIWVALHCRPKCIMHSLLKSQCQLWIHWCSLWNNFDLAQMCLDNDYKSGGESTLILSKYVWLVIIRMMVSQLCSYPTVAPPVLLGHFSSLGLAPYLRKYKLSFLLFSFQWPKWGMLSLEKI